MRLIAPPNDTAVELCVRVKIENSTLTTVGEGGGAKVICGLILENDERR